MTEQPAAQTMAQAAKAPLGADEPDKHHGRPTSWSVTAMVIVGFVLGGIALCIGPSWVMFWVGAGIVVLGVIVGWAVRIFDDWY